VTKITVRTATEAMFKRYILIIREKAHDDESSLSDEAQNDHLTWMCIRALENLNVWPEDKLSRWLGYVQGVLTVRGVIDVQEEREISRPLFHAAYRAADIAVPATLNNN
jgi:hypothetical protein